MTIRIVTDSTADIPPAIARALRIEVIPAYVRFGRDYYRDGVDITPDRFLANLMSFATPPGIVPPTTEDIAATYRQALPADSCIVSIHTADQDYNAYASALQAKRLVGPDARIEVINARSISVGLGILVMGAARLVAKGGTVQNVIDETKKAILQVRMLAVFSSSRYALRSGHIGKARSLAARALHFAPVLTFQDGHPVPAGFARNTANGVEKLCNFVRENQHITDLAIAHTTSPNELTLLRESLASLFPPQSTIISPLGPAICAHAGPNALLVAVKRAGK